MNRERGAWKCGAWNVFVLDSARCSLPIQLLERRPAVVCPFRLAAALDLIPVLPAFRADSLAILAAYALHGQRQQHKLAQDLVQLQSFTFVEAHFGLARVDLRLIAVPFLHGTIVQREI